MTQGITHVAVGAGLTMLLGAVAVALFVPVTAFDEHRGYRTPRNAESV